MTDDRPIPIDLSLLIQRVDELEAQLTRALADLDELAAAAAHTTESHLPTNAVGEPVYGTVTAWVDGYFRRIFTRSIGGEIRWCGQWEAHPEAVTRFEALWRSWEALRLDPNLGIATWLTSYLDPQLAALFSRLGPFAQCTHERHTPCGDLGQ